MQPLQNVLSISTAGKNRYLLHFNSFHSLAQWTAGIRLAMFEHASLQEAYTGSIIAGKGKMLNNIRIIMERNRFKQEDWARVRFGAGTPWRRCWYVITPPDEKQYQKLQKSMKKKSAYDRPPPMPTGTLQFYESKKTKKAKPIATITDVFSAYSIYPQSKPLIDQSTLVKIEGQITIHSQAESVTDGFVFVMPEVHPAVSGFEMMLRFLFPIFDTFSLYGRPTRLMADTSNAKSIMFAFPKHKRYGYLDILDVANLIQIEGSRNWGEREWRKQLKDATARRMTSQGSRNSSIRTRQRASLPSRSGVLRYRDSKRSATSPASRPEFNQSADTVYQAVPKADSVSASSTHTRTASDTTGFAMGHQRDLYVPLPLEKPHLEESVESEERPETKESSERTSSESDRKELDTDHAETIGQHLRPSSPPSPVVSPPAFAHNPGEIPQTRPIPSAELRKANVRMSDATLLQLVEAGRLGKVTGASERKNLGAREPGQREVIHDNTSILGATANANVSPQRTPGNKTAKSDECPPPVPVHSSHDLNTKGQEVARSSPQHFSNLPRIDTTKAIARKPLPPPPPPESQKEIPSEPSLGSLRHTLDEDALNRIVARQTSYSPERDIQPDEADEESVYDDDGTSTASPDYASTRKTDDGRSEKSIPKPRMGVMKTVGAEVEPQDVVIGDARYKRDAPSTPKAEIPAVDFGPTLSYVPTTKSPHASDALGKFGHHRKDSEATIGANEIMGRNSPGAAIQNRAHSRTPSGDEFRRNVLWQPGMASSRPSTPGPALTPEQFVQQRVIMNSVPSPAYMQQRSSSMTPPPRPSSGDWTVHARRLSYNKELPPRPQSRGAASALGNELSSHLSAREQEHVARMTGSSFFNLSANNTKPVTHVDPAGLVSAIDAREREKKSMKEGMSNQMVEYAIAQRQQQVQQQQQQQAQMYAMQQHARGQSMYNLPTANRTWDTFNQMNHAYTMNGQGQSSWTGHLQPQQSTPPMSQANQYFQQYPGTYSDAGGMPFPYNR